MNPNGSNEMLFPGRVWQEREGKIFGVYFLFISVFFLTVIIEQILNQA